MSDETIGKPARDEWDRLEALNKHNRLVAALVAIRDCADDIEEALDYETTSIRLAVSRGTDEMEKHIATLRGLA